jgi:hypothetical protein
MKPYIKMYGLVLVASAIVGLMIAEQLYLTGILLIVAIILVIVITHLK